MKLDFRVYTTKAGRYVRQGDPEAAFLAYSAGKEVPRRVVEELGLKQASEPADKQADAPEDKQAEKPEDKALSGIHRKPRGRPKLPRDEHGNVIRE